MFSLKTTPCTQLFSKEFTQYGVTVWIKREDLNQPHIQGNKWHKLKLNIEAALRQGKTTLLTFGGAYSNHIAATAAAAQLAELKSIGIIRGQELTGAPEKWSHTLKAAEQKGMQFEFISRSHYRNKTCPDFLQALQKSYPDAYIIPEGGSNTLAVKGFESLMPEIEEQCPDWTHLFTAVGTGGTLAGLVSYAQQQDGRHIVGVPVLKKGEYLLPQIKNWIGYRPTNEWYLLTEYHTGGYAKTTPKLRQRMQQFEQNFEIDLDPIYTAKMVNAFYDQLEKKLIPVGSKIILLHTGGLQGRQPN
ncbi:MAG: 1-aminocyclopropane-1-carboxylate deaminase [Thiomicrorhabdus sp.]|nr:MAG: 1-aminocyclopropane-1-carboxylate deaminase [Thiomicrorhabdus sp.]